MRVCLFVMVAALAALAAPLHSATAYTNPAAFAAAVAGLAADYPISFDSQAEGTSALKYGITQIGAVGLQSDGSTVQTLQPKALSGLPYESAPNYLGEDTNGQFLAGNGDRIDFDLSHRVQAFGMYLIGNPSPTGAPAIPFWRLETSNGAAVYSSTDPLQTLAPGSDLYFLGVVEPRGIDTVKLFSDNDPAAAYSFNVDSVMWAAAATEANLASAKTLAPGTDVVLEGDLVTRVHSDRFNIESPDRLHGMAVIGTSDAERDDQIKLFGTTVMSSDEERVIQLIQVLAKSGGIAPKPLAMRNRFAGGEVALGDQIGCDGSLGPNNIGLDVTLWGRVTAVADDLSWMTINDSSQARDVRVTGQIGQPVLGQMIAASGSMSIIEEAPYHFPLLRVADASDVLLLAH